MEVFANLLIDKELAVLVFGRSNVSKVFILVKTSGFSSRHSAPVLYVKGHTAKSKNKFGNGDLSYKL